MQTWQEDEAFVLWLIFCGYAWKREEELCHRIAGGDEGVAIVWKAWLEGVEEGKQIINQMDNEEIE